MRCKTGFALLGGVALIYGSWLISWETIRFRSLAQAQKALEREGYYCSTDRADGKIESGGFLVSRDSMTWDQVSTVCKGGKMGREWQRMAWVTLRNCYLGDLWGGPEGADVRLFGNVYFVGETKFLDELENALRTQMNRRN